MDKLIDAWRALGPVGPCALLFLAGLLLVAGYFFKWQWLYPRDRANYKTGKVRRGMTVMCGFVLIVCGIVFYIFRDSMHWQ